MAITTTPPTTQAPTPPPSKPPGSPRALIVITVVVILAALATAGYVVMTNRNSTSSKPAATPKVQPPSAVSQPSSANPPASSSAPTSQSTILGPSGDPANWPAAQSTAPSLDGLYASPPDLVAFVKTLQNYIDWVYSHPDPSLVVNYMLPDSSTYQGQINDLTYLKTNGWHTRPNPTEIDFLKITEAPQPNPVVNGKTAMISGHPSYRGGLINIVINISGGPLYDRAGAVVKSFPPTGQVAYSWSLAQGTDGRWRIADQHQLNPPGGVAAIEQQ